MNSDLRSYYEEEARRRLRGAKDGPRVGLRAEYLTVLEREGRHSVLDFGAGPGPDAEAFHRAGLRYVGIDLALGNAVLAAERGITVLHGSVTAPPVRPRSFDAGWSMSTLMHLPAAEVTEAVAAMAGALRIGAPLMVGLWGAEQADDVTDERGIEGQRRPFHLRTLDHNRELLSACGTIEHIDEWRFDDGDGDHRWHYHVLQVRIGP